MKTIETINKHFKTLGGLYNISHEKSLSLHDLENEIRSIENYLGKDVPKLLRDILIKYHGYSFNNEVGFNVTTHIPILGNSIFLEFGQFLSMYQKDLFDILENNEDLFRTDILPFAEATPGDYIAFNMQEQSVYFISHDFSENEQSHIKIADSLKDYFLHLCERAEEKEVLEKSPKIISVRYSDEFLAIIQKWKNKNTSNKES